MSTRPAADPLEFRQIVRRERNNGTFRWYATYSVPSEPGYPRRMHATTVRLRLDTSAADERAGLNRAERLRGISEHHPHWQKLIGLRNSIESVNERIKRSLTHDRAPSVEPMRNTLYLLLDAILYNFEAVVTHDRRLSRASSPPTPAAA